MRRMIALVGCLGAVAVLTAGCGPGESTDFSGDLGPFFVEPLRDLPMGKPRRHGKVLALDVDTRALAPLHDELPDALRARAPDEVGTVALIHCATNKVRDYTFWMSGYTHICDMKLVAYPSRELLVDTGVSMAPPTRVRFPLFDRIPARPTHILLSSVLELPDAP